MPKGFDYAKGLHPHEFWLWAVALIAVLSGVHIDEAQTLEMTRPLLFEVITGSFGSKAPNTTNPERLRELQKHARNIDTSQNSPIGTNDSESAQLVNVDGGTFTTNERNSMIAAALFVAAVLSFLLTVCIVVTRPARPSPNTLDVERADYKKRGSSSDESSSRPTSSTGESSGSGSGSEDSSSYPSESNSPVSWLEDERAELVFASFQKWKAFTASKKAIRSARVSAKQTHGQSTKKNSTATSSSEKSSSDKSSSDKNTESESPTESETNTTKTSDRTSKVAKTIQTVKPATSRKSRGSADTTTETEDSFNYRVGYGSTRYSATGSSVTPSFHQHSMASIRPGSEIDGGSLSISVATGAPSYMQRKANYAQERKSEATTSKDAKTGKQGELGEDDKTDLEKLTLRQRVVRLLNPKAADKGKSGEKLKRYKFKSSKKKDKGKPGESKPADET